MIKKIQTMTKFVLGNGKKKFKSTINSFWSSDQQWKVNHCQKHLSYNIKKLVAWFGD